ncbi:MAG TPA: cupin domain-containing protein [Bryobacteraceae bacterium]|nr:cupin domain-containing protein [Bryobacteraceae bacterium]
MTATPAYTLIANVDPAASVPADGILSRTIYTDGSLKVIQFTFAPGAELSAHTAPFPAAIYIVRGEAELLLGGDSHRVAAGAFVQMPARLEHAVHAVSELVLLLTLHQGARS